MSVLKRYLVGFKCYAHGTGCECNIDVPRDVKERFEETHGFEYDDYCLYDFSEGETEDEALENAYACCGAADEDTIRDGFPEVEIICEV
jgi:hypothetical protein